PGVIAVTGRGTRPCRNAGVEKPRRYTQKELQKRLEAAGWVKTTGGKHVVKMVKPGRRAITIPICRGETLSVGLCRRILKQAGIDGRSHNGKH
ncbi:MAG TPA: type II toxin-antitoxin system HicA family toxin, partial [Actinomycetota bacterium]|nr:type II toxin-antitoxin system HicA family toxin [Actinomycetota bacterium]